MDYNSIQPNMLLQAEWNNNGTSTWDNVIVIRKNRGTVDIAWTSHSGTQVRSEDPRSEGWSLNHLRRRPLQTDISDQRAVVIRDQIRTLLSEYDRQRQQPQQQQQRPPQPQPQPQQQQQSPVVNWDFILRENNVFTVQTYQSQGGQTVSMTPEQGRELIFYKLPFFCRYNEWSDYYASENVFNTNVLGTRIVVLDTPLVNIFPTIIQRFSRNNINSGTRDGSLLFRPHFLLFPNERIPNNYSSNGTINVTIYDQNSQIIYYNIALPWHTHDNTLSPNQPQINMQSGPLNMIDKFFIVEINLPGTTTVRRFNYYLIGDDVQSQRGRSALQRYFQ